MQNKIRCRLILFFAVLFSSPLSAQVGQHLTLKEAAQAAVLKSPDVEARWHAFREATEEAAVARGAFLPRIDFSAGSGREKIVQDRVGTNVTFGGNDRTLSLRQMLFDGLATASEVNRLGRAALARYFELLDASENTALEAGRAYLDVVRYRYQIFLAEENYIQHQAAYEQLKQRAESGVGKRVDVDQAASRLALADVNLTTAYANLHDVTARYLRLVGQPPAKVMFAPAQLAKALPKDVDTALLYALKNNPALRASIENIESAQYDLEGRRAAFLPKVDVVARRDEYSNYLGNGPREDSRVELRMNYNLFSGGSDMARSRQYRERKNIALDQREKACRDLRQTVSIAFNETLRLNDQLSFIGVQVNLVEKTRTAYRDQFNIGQRTLLDLLNTQNEYFDSRRSQVNADIDLSIAYLRSYAGMGRLLEVLGLKRKEAENAPDEDELTAVDLAQLCPPTAPVGTTLDREALGRKAKEMMEGAANNFIGGRPLGISNAPGATVVPVANPETSPGNAVPLSNPEPNPGSAAPLTPEAEIAARTAAWGAAWAARETKTYLAFYAPTFTPDNGLSREAWAKQRAQRLGRSGDVRLEIQNLVVRSATPDTAVAEFRQIYRSGAFSDTTDKRIEWRRIDGQWLIELEKSRPAAKGA
jgi:adhesin transport system outer membrane protein